MFIHSYHILVNEQGIVINSLISMNQEFCPLCIHVHLLLQLVEIVQGFFLKWWIHNRGPTMKHETHNWFSWNLEVWIGGHNIDLFFNGEWTKFLVIIFFKSHIVLMLCCQSQTISLTLKLSCSLWCLSTFFLYCIYACSKLNKSHVWTYANHMIQSFVIGITFLFAP